MKTVPFERFVIENDDFFSVSSINKSTWPCDVISDTWRVFEEFKNCFEVLIKFVFFDLQQTQWNLDLHHWSNYQNKTRCHENNLNESYIKWRF